MGVLVVQATEGKLLEIVGALHLSGRLPRRLHRRQQQRDQDADDRYYYKQLNQGKTLWQFLNCSSWLSDVCYAQTTSLTYAVTIMRSRMIHEGYEDDWKTIFHALRGYPIQDYLCFRHAWARTPTMAVSNRTIILGSGT